MATLTAYVPVFNQAANLPMALRSLHAQTIKPSSVVVVDDASTDNSADVARALGAQVISFGVNQGRGAARDAAMAACNSEFVLCCDATCRLEPHFAERAMYHLRCPNVAAVFGVYGSANVKTTSDRWRARHLFKVGRFLEIDQKAAFSTYGAMVRKSSVEEAGGYNKTLKQCEDADLGDRLRQLQLLVLRDPTCLAISTISNSIPQVLERYWRWNVGLEPRFSLRQYLAKVRYSMTEMLKRDLRARDYSAAMVTLVCPHYEAWRTWMHKEASQTGD
jgi:glycosyltransferase involved in cell wall biosynthesis